MLRGSDWLLGNEGVAGQWDRLPKEAGTVPSLPEFKKCSDNSQTNGFIFGWSCVESDIEPNESFGSLLTWDIL